MGGGSTVRTVSLDVDGGTLETNGLATFDNRADLNLVSGTVNFNGGATFNAGSRIDWTGGTLNLGARTTLLVDGESSTGPARQASSSAATPPRESATVEASSRHRIRSGHRHARHDGGGLTVGTTGGTISDWGGNGATTTATLTNNAVATYNSGLRMGVFR